MGFTSYTLFDGDGKASYGNALCDACAAKRRQCGQVMLREGDAVTCRDCGTEDCDVHRYDGFKDGGRTRFTLCLCDNCLAFYKRRGWSVEPAPGHLGKCTRCAIKNVPDYFTFGFVRVNSKHSGRYYAMSVCKNCFEDIDDNEYHSLVVHNISEAHICEVCGAEDQEWMSCREMAARELGTFVALKKLGYKPKGIGMEGFTSYVSGGRTERDDHMIIAGMVGELFYAGRIRDYYVDNYLDEYSVVPEVHMHHAYEIYVKTYSTWMMETIDEVERLFRQAMIVQASDGDNLPVRVASAKKIRKMLKANKEYYDAL